MDNDTEFDNQDITNIFPIVQAVRNISKPEHLFNISKQELKTLIERSIEHWEYEKIRLNRRWEKRKITIWKYSFFFIYEIIFFIVPVPVSPTQHKYSFIWKKD